MTNATKAGWAGVAFCAGLLVYMGVTIHVPKADAAGRSAATALRIGPLVLQSATINGVPGQTITLDSAAVMNLSTFVQSLLPTKLSQLTNDTGFITTGQALQASTTTFAASTLLAAGTYGPNTLSLANATTGMAVECNIVNMTGNGYNARGTVTGTGTAAVTLYVTTALTLNTTAPIVKCFPY